MTNDSPKFQVGQIIQWQSQSAGSWVKKRGTVLAVLQPHQHLTNTLRAIGRTDISATNRIKATSIARHARYLVEVPQFAKPKKRGDAPVAKPSCFYAPLVRVIDGDSGGRGKAVEK